MSQINTAVNKTNESQIKVNDIKVDGMDLLSDSESFFNLLGEDEMESISGGAAAACCTCHCSRHAA